MPINIISCWPQDASISRKAAMNCCPGEMSAAAQGLAAPEVRAEWERETAATLKSLGFPSSEGMNSAVSLVPRVATCLTRRLVNLGEFLLELEKADEESKGKQKKGADAKVESILTKTFGCKHNCVKAVNHYIICKTVYSMINAF